MDEFTLGIVLHPRNDVSASVVRILAWAQVEGVTLLTRPADAARLPGVTPVEEDAFADRVAGIVSLGGDGTMLGAMRLVAGRNVPVLGVNHGNLGFLIEVQPESLEWALGRLIRQQFSIEDHHGLRLSGQDFLPGEPDVAFNDIVLRAVRGATSVDLGLAGERYGYYRCDVVVVATPAGSTAYNYAAGGPVISPSAQVCVVTPVAPMSGISRALVLGPEEHMVLSVPTDSTDIAVEIDGVPARTVPAGRQIRIDLWPGAGKVVRFRPHLHRQQSNLKLSLLDLPLRPDQLLEVVPPELRRSFGARMSGLVDPDAAQK